MAEDEVGRPTIMTPEIVAKLEEAFLWGCSDLEACLHARIGKSTLYNYQNVNPEFVERKEQLKKNPTLRARKCVFDGIESDSDLSLRYLERKERDEFSTKNEINSNLTFTQMPAIAVTGADCKQAPVKLTFNIGEEK